MMSPPMRAVKAVGLLHPSFAALFCLAWLLVSNINLIQKALVKKLLGSFF